MVVNRGSFTVSSQRSRHVEDPAKLRISRLAPLPRDDIVLMRKPPVLPPLRRSDSSTTAQML